MFYNPTEQKIAKQCVKDLISGGFTVSVYDGEETTVKQSTELKKILEAMSTTDEDFLIAYKDGKRFGWVRFVYGNDGWDVINDYTTNLEDTLAKTDKLIEKLEQER